jgi:hypothetical protein
MIESIEIAQKGVSSNDGGRNRPSLCSKVPLDGYDETGGQYQV